MDESFQSRDIRHTGPRYLFVSNSKTVRPRQGAPYVVFNVTVNGEALQGYVSGDNQAGVWKRYSQFLELQEALATEYPTIQLKLPGKDMFKKKLNEKHVGRRQTLIEQGLNEFLAPILTMGRPIPDEFVRFLALQQNLIVNEVAEEKSLTISTEQISTDQPIASMESTAGSSEAIASPAPAQEEEAVQEATCRQVVAEREEMVQAAMAVPKQREVAQIEPARVARNLESATQFLGFTNTASELRSVLQDVVPVSPYVVRNAKWIGLVFVLKIVVAAAARSFPRLRKLLAASAFTMVSALAGLQSKENQDLRDVLQSRVEGSERKARDSGKLILSASSSVVSDPTKLAVDWLVQTLGGGAASAGSSGKQETVEVVKPVAKTTPELAVASRSSPQSGPVAAPEAVTDPLIAKMEALFANKDHAAVLEAAEYSLDTAAFLPSAPAHSSGVVWRVARALYMLSYYEPLKSSKEQRSKVLLAGAKLALDAAAPDPYDGALCHKWTGILTMHNAVSIPEKVHASHTFQEHTQLALASGRGDFDCTLHFAVGKFQAGISELGWIERRAASAIAGKPLPAFTWEDALKSFKTCVSMRPEGKAMAMDLGQMGLCLDGLKRKSEATEAFRACLRAPIMEPDDEEAHEIAKKRLGK